MANWSLPSLTSLYTNFLTELTDRDNSVATWFNSSINTDTNIPVNTVRWNATGTNWEKWSGTVWNPLTTTYGISITGYSSNIVGGNNTTLLGSLPYQSNTNITTLLGPNVTAIKKFLTQTGTGTNGAVPVWAGIIDADLPATITGKTFTGCVIGGTTGTFSSTLGVTGLITSTGGISGGAASHTTGTFSSTLDVTGLITSTGGISGGAASHTTGTFSSTLGVTGLITSTGGISGGAASHTTGTFSSTLSCAGFSATTGTFSAGISATTGNFLGQLTVVGDIVAYKNATPTTGVIFLNQAGTRYLFNDGANYQLPGQGLNVGGGIGCTTFNATTGTFSGAISGITGTFSSTLGVTGLISSTGGISGGAASHTTGTFSGILIGNIGVQGIGTTGVGVQGNSTSNFGIVGFSTSSYGAVGSSTSGIGVFAQSTGTGSPFVLGGMAVAPSTSVVAGCMYRLSTTNRIFVYSTMWEEIQSGKYDSGTIGASVPAANTAVSLTHGLGVTPSNIRVVAVCVTPTFGYANGDEIEVSLCDYASVNMQNGPGANSTNIFFNSGSNISIPDKNITVGSHAIQGSTAFRLKVYAWK